MVQTHSVPVVFVTQHNVSKHTPCFLSQQMIPFAICEAHYTLCLSTSSVINSRVASRPHCSMLMGVVYMFLLGVVCIRFSKAASGTDTIGHRICAS